MGICPDEAGALAVGGCSETNQPMNGGLGLWGHPAPAWSLRHNGGIKGASWPSQ